MTYREQQTLLPLYPLGLLEDEEERWVEAEAAANAEIAWELAGYREAAALCALAAPSATPDRKLRSRVMASVRTPYFTEAEPGIFVHRASDRDWSATPFPGVFVKQVCFDAATSMATSLIRMEPGSQYPHHLHTAQEQCYVISGDIRLGTVTLDSGDFSRACPGSHHGQVWTEKGCTLLIVACTHDKPGD